MVRLGVEGDGAVDGDRAVEQVEPAVGLDRPGVGAGRVDPGPGPRERAAPGDVVPVAARTGSRHRQLAGRQRAGAGQVDDGRRGGPVRLEGEAPLLAISETLAPSEETA